MLTYSIAATIVIIGWFFIITPSKREFAIKIIDSYEQEKFTGTIINKYIDKNEHSFNKIIIQEDNRERTLLFDQEIGGIYNFFNVGDSIVKKEGSLKVRVKRGKLDTVIIMKFLEIPD